MDYLDDISGEVSARLRQRQPLEARELSKADAVDVIFSGRILASVGKEVELRLANGESLRGKIDRATEKWLWLRLVRMDILVQCAGIELVQDLAGAPQWANYLEKNLPFAAALRELWQRGLEMTFTTCHHTVTGAVARVGKDFVDVADHGRNIAIPFPALLYVACPRH